MRHLTISSILAAPALAVILAAVVAVPAGADWIKTREGALVETRGAWKVKAGIVVFTSKNGTFSSMRLKEVDLDGSAQATFEAQQQASEAPAEVEKKVGERPTVLVLTNKDIPRAMSQPADAGSDPETDTEDGAASDQAAASPVTVTAWHQADKPELDGIELRGTVQNKSPNMIADLRVLVRLIGDDGESLGASNAFLGALSLAPKASTQFRALFPEATAMSFEPEFQVRSNSIKLGIVRPRKAEDNES